jgi:hypothetical protein
MQNRTPHELFLLAAQLFRENESMFGDVKQDKEKANHYRAMALLAEGLAKLSEEQNEAKKRTTAYRHPASIRPA